MSEITPDLITGPGGSADAELTRKVRTGLRWSLLSLFAGKGVSILSGIVLARILVPDDFGVYAVAIAVVNVLFGLNDLGLVVSIIRWDGDVRVAARTAMTMATVSSGLIYLACFALAPAFADAVDAPEAVGVLRLLALTVVLDGFVTVPHGLLVREFRQDRMAVIGLVSGPANFATAIVLAAMGAGPWSLAVGSLVGNSIAAVACLRFSPMPVGFGFSLATAKCMLRFGLPLAGTSVVEYILLNADYLVIGVMLGPVEGGFYLLAYNMSNWIVAALTDAVRPVALASFAELSKDKERIGEKFAGAYVLLLTVTIFFTVAMVVLAPAVVGFVYGTKWERSAEVLRLLAVLGAARVAIGLVVDLLMGTGRSRMTLALHGCWLVLLLPAIVVGAHLEGIRGVGVAHAVVGVVVVPLFLLSLKRHGVRVSAVFVQLVRPAVGGAATAVVGVVLSPLIDGHFVRLAIVGPAMLVTYTVVVVPWNHLRPSVIRQFLRERRSPPPAPVTVEPVLQSAQSSGVATT